MLQYQRQSPPAAFDLIEDEDGFHVLFSTSEKLESVAGLAGGALSGAGLIFLAVVFNVGKGWPNLVVPTLVRMGLALIGTMVILASISIYRRRTMGVFVRVQGPTLSLAVPCWHRVVVQDIDLNSVASITLARDDGPYFAVLTFASGGVTHLPLNESILGLDQLRLLVARLQAAVEEVSRKRLLV